MSHPQDNEAQTLLKLRRIDPEMFAELAGNDTHLTHCAHCGGRLHASWVCEFGCSATGPYFHAECLGPAMRGERQNSRKAALKDERTTSSTD